MNVSVSYIGMVNSHYLTLGVTNINVFGYEFDNKGKITGYCYSGGWLEKQYFSKGLIRNIYDFFFNDRIHSFDFSHFKTTSDDLLRNDKVETKTFFEHKSNLFDCEI